jgi:hypothetical protein
MWLQGLLLFVASTMMFRARARAIGALGCRSAHPPECAETTRAA